MTAMKNYTVHVALTIRFWGHVEVLAENQAEAEALAGDLLDCDWNCAVQEGVETTVLTEDGCPVKFSAEAYAADPTTPYQKVTAKPLTAVIPGTPSDPETR